VVFQATLPGWLLSATKHLSSVADTQLYVVSMLWWQQQAQQ